MGWTSRDGGLFGGIVRPDGKPREGAAIGLTNQEKATRVRALQDAIKAEEDRQAIPAAASSTATDVVTQEPREAAVATEPVELAGDGGETPTEADVAVAALPAEAPVDAAPDHVEPTRTRRRKIGRKATRDSRERKHRGLGRAPPVRMLRRGAKSRRSRSPRLPVCDRARRQRERRPMLAASRDGNRA